MKKGRLFVKAVSLVMAIIMTLAVVPVQAISLPQENEDISNEIVSTGNIETADQEVFIVEEDTSKRDQFEKHYLCSDGTYVSVTYPEAIHYLNDDNIWQDVDQSLTYNGMSDVYSSDNADFNVSFAAKGSSSNIVRIEKDGYVLSWGIQATGKTPLIVSDRLRCRCKRFVNILTLPLTNMVSTPQGYRLRRDGAVEYPLRTMDQAGRDGHRPHRQTGEQRPSPLRFRRQRYPYKGRMAG